MLKNKVKHRQSCSKWLVGGGFI